MNFFIIMGALSFFLYVNAKTRLLNCKSTIKEESKKEITFPYGVVCTKISCDWSVDSTCKNGTHSAVLKWDTDIFEIVFEGVDHRRPKELVIKIDLNENYYVEIKVFCVKERRAVDVILNECSHKEKQCWQNGNFTQNVTDIKKDETYVAIGFRKDKKMNFVAVTGRNYIATDLFGPENEYEFNMPGFNFNTEETMKITVSSKFEKNYTYDGVLFNLPTSVGGFFFNKHGYLINEKDSWCDKLYINPNETEGLPYIIKEYFKNSENWKATPVKWTPSLEVPYFDENGMKFKPEEMKIKEAKNPNFDENKMRRKGCKYVAKPETKPETKPVADANPEVPEAQATVVPFEAGGGFTDLLSEIRIGDEIFIRTDVSEKNINIREFIERVGKKSLHQDYLNRVFKGGDDYNITLANGTEFNLRNYKFKIPSKKKEGGGGAQGKGKIF
ncbi:UNVERIFIED_CONTAM: hypothetical protein RMT77_014913 [Armadillidium vulgare]